MRTDRLLDSLTALFHSNTVVFWHDVDDEFSGALDGLELDGVVCVPLDQAPALSVNAPDPVALNLREPHGQALPPPVHQRDTPQNLDGMSFWHVSSKALLEELEVTPATLKRDLDYLEDQLGAPVEYDRFLNGYRFGQEYRGQKHELPGLWFSERELYSLLMANQLLSELDSEGVISRHLQLQLERIHQVRDTGEADVKALLKRVKIIRSAKCPVSSQFFELIGEALLKRRRIHVRYRSRERGKSNPSQALRSPLVSFESAVRLTSGHELTSAGLNARVPTNVRGVCR